MSAPNLKLVINAETGEVVEPDCPECRRHLDEISGLERDLRGWAVRYAQLKRDKDTDAREHPMWPVGERIFREWRSVCRHPRSPWTPDRFWVIEPFLTNAKYGQEVEQRVALCRRAVAGAAFDAFEVKRKNGTVKRFDEWARVFKDSSNFEDFCNRAPKGWTP
jgi:hypothetical protein